MTKPIRGLRASLPLYDDVCEFDIKIDQLLEIVTELDARNCSNNCVIPELIGKSWSELCDDAIELLEQIKE
jgi:hypothetical protein